MMADVNIFDICSTIFRGVPESQGPGSGDAGRVSSGEGSGRAHIIIQGKKSRRQEYKSTPPPTADR